MDCIILPPSSFNCLYQSSTVCPNLSTCTMLITQLVDLTFKCGRLKRQTTCPCAIQDKMNWINSWGPPLQACLALPRGNEVSATLHSWWGPEHPWRCRSPLRECSSPKRTAANWYTAAPWPPVQTHLVVVVVIIKTAKCRLFKTTRIYSWLNHPAERLSYQPRTSPKTSLGTLV